MAHPDWITGRAGRVRALRRGYPSSEGVAALVRGGAYSRSAADDSPGRNMGVRGVRSSVAGTGLRTLVTEGGGCPN